MGIAAIFCIFVAFQMPVPEQPELLAVKTELVDRFGFAKRQVDSLFSDSRLKRYPQSAFPKGAWSWENYTKEILSPASVRAGRKFLEEHRLIFQRAEEQFGVESHYLVSLLRVETHLGQNLGRYSVMNILYTRLQEKNRRTWAEKNLIALSVYCLLYEIDCYAIKGSYAGAFGLPQFLPLTLVYYGVDADGDGVENLFSVEDAVMSAANYLVALGWHEDKTRALALYYGSSRGYPVAVRRYALAVKRIE